MKLTKTLLSVSVTAALMGVSFARQDVPSNLGNGLDRLVASNVAVQKAKLNKTAAKLTTFAARDGRAYTTEESAALSNLAIHDTKADRIMVRINPDGTVKIDALSKALASSIKSYTQKAMDKTYRGVGVMNAYVSLDDVATVAQTKGVRSVILELQPRHAKTAMTTSIRPVTNVTSGQNIPNLGTYVDQGIFQHRVDTLDKYYNPTATMDFEGSGLSIACISNSFNANAAHPATLDVTNNDLPGNASNPVGNTTPVFVLLDDTASSTSDDEGRGMCEIVYHMAPKAKVGFATADAGEVGFANAIRGLAGINSTDFPNASTDGFAADVVCDDVSYPDEPFYEDGIIANGIDDVAAAGVSYFSSAGNDVDVNGYESVIRLIPNGTGLTAAAGNTALANTNIDLTGVPANLYAGGFHNFNPTPGQIDVAQTVNIAANNTVPFELQWNDPYDQATQGAVPVTQIYANTGTISTTQTTQTYDNTSTPPLPPFTAGQPYIINEMHTSGNYDAIVTITKPDNTTLLTQDTGVDERVVFTAPVTGQYKITFAAYNNTTGNFSFTVSTATLSQYVTSDWNVLAFRTDTGAYVAASSLTTDNLASNEPIELGFVNRTSSTVRSIQVVFARSNTPTGPHVADHLRYLLSGNGRAGYGPAEYFTYNTVTTGGHAAANGCNGVAAYEVFRPSIPQNFTSPGPVVTYFDKNHNLLATPDVRLQPGVAAANGGNISLNEGLAGLGGGDVPGTGDSTSDFDTVSNFYGTSAASPHAAALALLVLEAHGGSRSVTPSQMSDVLHRSAFLHDLDPATATSNARATNGGKIALNFNSDNTSNAGTGVNDANALSVAYTGPSYITSLVFNPAGAAATGGNVTGGNNGLDASNNYFTNTYPGMVFPAATTTFAVGSKSVGLTSSDVTAATSNLAGPPSTTQNWTLSLAFPNSNFTGGKILRFTISRSIQHSSSVASGSGPTGGTTVTNYSGDLFGGGVQIPEGTVTTNGMAYSGTLGDGSTFSGFLTNRIGSGYSALDGFGFINEQTAVSAPLQ